MELPCCRKSWSNHRNFRIIIKSWWWELNKIQANCKIIGSEQPNFRLLLTLMTIRTSKHIIKILISKGKRVSRPIPTTPRISVRVVSFYPIKRRQAPWLNPMWNNWLTCRDPTQNWSKKIRFQSWSGIYIHMSFLLRLSHHSSSRYPSWSFLLQEDFF